MRTLLFLALCALLSACTRIAFVTPVGKPVTSAIADDLVGDWTGEKGGVWHVERIPNTSELLAKWTQDGKDQSCRFLLTTIGADIFIVWAEDKELSAYLPLRVSGAEDALTLLYPDEKEVELLVGNGKLTAVHDKEKRSWTIPQGNWEPLLERKDFWRIDTCMPFTKIKTPTKALAPTSTPATTPAAQEPRQPVAR
jgi:hypothetical protein